MSTQEFGSCKDSFSRLCTFYTDCVEMCCRNAIPPAGNIAREGQRSCHWRGCVGGPSPLELFQAGRRAKLSHTAPFGFPRLKGSKGDPLHTPPRRTPLPPLAMPLPPAVTSSKFRYFCANDVNQACIHVQSSCHHLSTCMVCSSACKMQCVAHPLAMSLMLIEEKEWFGLIPRGQQTLH